jgi:hypothetical protein
MTNKPLGSSKELYPLVDYVCVYGLPLSKQTELFTNTQSYSEPGLDGECLIRYPFDDYEKFALPVLLHYFTFPNSIIPSKEPKSIGRDGLSYHSFVMTEENGVKYYGFCVTRWNRCHNRIKYVFLVFFTIIGVMLQCHSLCCRITHSITLFYNFSRTC